MLAVPVLILFGLVIVGLLASVRVLKQYERGVQFRLGKVKGEGRGPGVILITPLIDRVHRVSLRIVTMPIQSHGLWMVNPWPKAEASYRPSSFTPRSRSSIVRRPPARPCAGRPVFGKVLLSWRRYASR